MHRSRIFYALICINKHVLSCLISMLSLSNQLRLETILSSLGSNIKCGHLVCPCTSKALSCGMSFNWRMHKKSKLIISSMISDEITHELDVEKTFKQTRNSLRIKSGGVPRLCKSGFQSLKRH